MVFDIYYQYFTSDHYKEKNIKLRKDLYVDAIDELPTNEPKPRGIPIHTNCFVEYDHAGDKDTRRS